MQASENCTYLAGNILNSAMAVVATTQSPSIFYTPLARARMPCPRVWVSGWGGGGRGFCPPGGGFGLVWFGRHLARGPAVSRCLKAEDMGGKEALSPELPLPW